MERLFNVSESRPNQNNLELELEILLAGCMSKSSINSFDSFKNETCKLYTFRNSSSFTTHACDIKEADYFAQRIKDGSRIRCMLVVSVTYDLHLDLQSQFTIT